jgi:hypothetical protein
MAVATAVTKMKTGLALMAINKINSAEQSVSFRGRSRRIWSLNTPVYPQVSRSFSFCGKPSMVRNVENNVLGQLP